MKRWARFLALAAALLVVAGAEAFAQSQIADHLQAVAEEAYVMGDYERAFRYFQLAYEADRGRLDNLHRQALCAGHLGQYKKAEVLLQEVVRHENARPDARFDLGVALYMLNRFPEALVQFDLAAAAGVRVPTLDYYRGACLFRLGQFDQALAPLGRAFDDFPGQQTWLGYYLGGSELAQEKYEQALAHLTRAYAETPPGPFHDRIGRLLALAKEKRRLSRWWSLALDLGGAWDSNVIYEPEDYEVAEREGYYGYVDTTLGLYPIRRDKVLIGVGYRFYQNLHLDNTDEGMLSDYNLTSNAPWYEMNFRLASGSVPVYLGAGYRWSRLNLAGERYQDAHTVTPHLNVAETHWTATRIGSHLEFNSFADLDERNAYYSSPYLSQLFSFGADSGRMLLEGSYEHNDADGEAYTYRGVGSYVAIDLPLVGPLSALSGFRYRYLEYTKSDENRLDRKITVDAALRVEATPWLAFTAGYRFRNNVSLDQYSYVKHVVYTSIGLSF